MRKKHVSENKELRQQHPHAPELMRVEKLWRKGVLQTHRVDLMHDCGDEETITQEELPWLMDDPDHR